MSSTTTGATLASVEIAPYLPKTGAAAGCETGVSVTGVVAVTGAAMLTSIGSSMDFPWVELSPLVSLRRVKKATRLGSEHNS